MAQVRIERDLALAIAQALPRRPANYVEPLLDARGRSLCGECGDVIPKKRMNALQWVMHCADCAQQAEAQKRRTYGK